MSYRSLFLVLAFLNFSIVSTFNCHVIAGTTRVWRLYQFQKAFRSPDDQAGSVSKDASFHLAVFCAGCMCGALVVAAIIDSWMVDNSQPDNSSFDSKKENKDAKSEKKE